MCIIIINLVKAELIVFILLLLLFYLKQNCTIFDKLVIVLNVVNLQKYSNYLISQTNMVEWKTQYPSLKCSEAEV